MKMTLHCMFEKGKYFNYLLLSNDFAKIIDFCDQKSSFQSVSISPM